MPRELPRTVRRRKLQINRVHTFLAGALLGGFTVAVLDDDPPESPEPESHPVAVLDEAPELEPAGFKSIASESTADTTTFVGPPAPARAPAEGADLPGSSAPAEAVFTEAFVGPPAPPKRVDAPSFVGPPAPPENRIVTGAVKRNQFVSDVLTSAGATSVEADRAVRALTGIYDFRSSRPGHRYKAEIAPGGEILAFSYKAGPAEIYEVVRDGDQLLGRKKKVEQKREIAEVSGTIEHSLYEAFLAAGETENLAMSFADAFRFDVDFFHDTRKGDDFKLFVEKFVDEEGELIRYGRVLAAQYAGAPGSPVGTKQLYWFDNRKTGTRGYFDEKGTAAQRAFLKSPLRFTRISSGFGYRSHPVNGHRHFHGGVDYAAPTGTPVQAIGEGVVTFAARKGPNGNMVKIRHAGGYESYYLHLSRIQVRSGQRVSQSTVIGRVGSTGRSTGPHLDFRIKKHGKYLNPTKQVAPRVKSIARADRPVFRKAIARWRNRFEDSTNGTILAKR